MPFMRLLFCVCFGATLFAGSARAECRDEAFENASYFLCRFSPHEIDLRYVVNTEKRGLTLKDGADAFAADLDSLFFLTNSGMFDDVEGRFRPKGLIVVDQRIAQPPDCLNKAFGNFYLQPNGLLAVKNNGDIVVARRSVYISETCAPKPAVRGLRFALQSGPMLVVDGRLPRRFLAESAAPSLYVRSGVGVGKDETGKNAVFAFALSHSEISLGQFARFFRKHVRADNALYLDGHISRAYAPQQSWPLDDFKPFGGVLAAFAKR